MIPGILVIPNILVLAHWRLLFISTWILLVVDRGILVCWHLLHGAPLDVFLIINWDICVEHLLLTSLRILTFAQTCSGEVALASNQFQELRVKGHPGSSAIWAVELHPDTAITEVTRLHNEQLPTIL